MVEEATLSYRCNSLALLLALASAGVHFACTEPDPLDSLIARHVEARGGLERLEAIETLRASGRAIAGPLREALITREVRPPDRIRTEFVYQGVTAVYACDGARCWFVDPIAGSFEPELMSEPDANEAIEDADLVGALVDWKAKGHSVELLGNESVDGREAFKLKVTLAGGGVRTDYLDAETALLVRREATETIRGRTVRGSDHLQRLQGRRGGGLPPPDSKHCERDSRVPRGHRRRSRSQSGNRRQALRDTRRSLSPTTAAGASGASHLEPLPFPPGPLHRLAKPCVAADVVQVPVVLGEKGVVDHSLVDRPIEPEQRLVLGADRSMGTR